MSDNAPGARHLVVPFAGGLAPGASQGGEASPLQGLELPNLTALLARLAPEAPDAGPEDSFSAPHERALAAALGLPREDDGLIPWAAAEALAAGNDAFTPAWAFVTPCRWQVGMNEVQQDDPAALGIDAAESKALMDAMRPYFAEDGITLLPGRHPGEWLAHGEPLRALPTASLDRVIGRDLEIWNLSFGARARPLRRLQQEMQMLLYTHPVNEAREARRATAINSFWISGTGSLPSGWRLPADTGVRVPDLLRAPALRQDTAAWQAAWRELDADGIAALLHASRAGRPVAITLCGQTASQRWSASGLGLAERLVRLVKPPRAAAALESL